jgi:hypothetical protein
MFVKHLQEYLDKFTEGPQGRRGNAVSNARIYIATPNGYLEEIRRIEVHESTTPGDTSIRVVLKPNKEEKLILPPGYIAEALGPCSSKLVERNIYLYRGSCITELVAQGLKLEPCCLGLEACASFLSKLGA